MFGKKRRTIQRQSEYIHTLISHTNRLADDLLIKTLEKECECEPIQKISAIAQESYEKYKDFVHNEGVDSNDENITLYISMSLSKMAGDITDIDRHEMFHPQDRTSITKNRVAFLVQALMAYCEAKKIPFSDVINYVDMVFNKEQELPFC